MAAAALGLFRPTTILRISPAQIAGAASRLFRATIPPSSPSLLPVEVVHARNFSTDNVSATRTVYIKKSEPSYPIVSQLCLFVHQNPLSSSIHGIWEGFIDERGVASLVNEKPFNRDFVHARNDLNSLDAAQKEELNSVWPTASGSMKKFHTAAYVKHALTAYQVYKPRFFSDALKFARPFMAGGARDIKAFLEKNFEPGKVYEVSEVLTALGLLVGADVRIQHTTDTSPAHLRSVIILYLEDRSHTDKPLILINHPPVTYDVSTVMVRVPPPPPATTTPTLTPPPSEAENAAATSEAEVEIIKDPPVDSLPSYDIELMNREITEFGMPMGPFVFPSPVGLGVGDVKGQHFIRQFPEGVCKSVLPSLMMEDGRFGRKMSGVSVDSKLTGMTDKDNTEMMIFPVVNEACYQDTDGISGKAADQDVAGDMSKGLPAYRGANMFWADSVGIWSKVGGVVG